MYEFKLPDVGEGLHEASIGRWLVQVGDVVRQDQPMVEIETDKALVEIPSPVAGRVVELRVAEGEVATVGTVIVVLEPSAKAVKSALPTPAAAPAPASASPNRTTTASTASIESSNVSATRRQPGLQGPDKRVLAAPSVRKLALTLGVDLSQVKGSGPAGRILASDVQQAKTQRAVTPDGAVVQQAAMKQAARVLAAPAVRKMAWDLGIELAEVRATGPSGRVLPQDVERYVQEQQASRLTQTESSAEVAGTPITTPAESAARAKSTKEAVERVPLRGLRRRIAQRMDEAWQIPHVTSFEEMDATELVALRQRLKPVASRQEVRLTYLPFIIKMTLQVLKENPYFNATIDMQKEEILLRHEYHIGIATAIPEGLVVPVLRHAEQMSMLEIAREVTRLSKLATQRKLSPHELSGSTFTITNFGSFGSYMGTPIINPPEVAILGCGRITKKPVVINDQIEIRSILPIALSYDHRLLDGAAAGKFLARLRELIEDPSQLLLELI